MFEDVISIRVRLLGFEQGEAKAKGLASGIAETGLAAEVASHKAVTASQRTTRAQDKARASLRRHAMQARSTGRTMTYGLTLPLGLVGAMAIRTAVDFDKSMAQVGVATKLGGEGMQRMEGLALEMGAKTIFSANESAEAMLSLSKAGMTPAQIRGGALAATMNLAAAGGMELAESGNLIGASMNTFSLKAGEAVRISDALAGAANTSSAELSDLAYSFQQAGQSANMAELTIYETAGALAAMADQGLRGSDAGTSLKTFLMRLNPVTTKAKEKMNELGLSFFDSNGNMVGMTQVSAKLHAALGDMTTQERNAALAVLFGSDAQRAANIIYNAGPASLRRYIRATEEKGAAEKMAAAQMEGLPGAIERMKGSLETAALVAGHAAAPAIMFLAGGIESLANGFTMLPAPLQTAVVAFGALVAIAGPVVWALGSMALAYERLGLAQSGVAGKMGKRMLIGGALGAGVAVGGQAMGGDLGGWLSNVGTGAAIGSAGGPLGMAIGAAGGGVLAAFSKVKGELADQPSRLQMASVMATKYAKQVQSAGASIIGTERRLGAARKRQRASAKTVESAQRRLTNATQQYGPGSKAALAAEYRLTRARNANRQAVKRLENAQRMHGQSLEFFKQIAQTAVLGERHEINELRRKAAAIGRTWEKEKTRGAGQDRLNELAERGSTVNRNLDKAQGRLNETLLEAAQKAGPKYATFLRNANQDAIRAGGNMKLLKERTDALAQSMERIGEIEMNRIGAGLPKPPSRNRGRGHPHGAGGFTNFAGGLAVVGENGPEVAWLPQGSDLYPAAPSRRLLRGEPTQVRGSSKVKALGASGGRTTARQPIVLQVGRRVLAEVNAEVVSDDEARL